MSEWSLRDKVILVTGGAAGIGAATAHELVQRGARLVLCDLDPAGLARTAQSLGGDPLTIELDVTDLRACERAVEQTLERHGGLDVVWANAGIASFGPLALADPLAWTRTIEVNLLGAYRTVRAALPAVLERRGYVAITASLAAFAHAPGMSAYDASKAGVEALGNALRMEVAHHGVQVATIHPSWIATDMVNEGERDQPAFRRLRAALRPPLNKTYPVSRAAAEIAEGFERRSRRICTPRFVLAAHALRPLLTTRLVERDLREAAPDIERLFGQEVRERGLLAASVSTRVESQVQAGDPLATH